MYSIQQAILHSYLSSLQEKNAFEVNYDNEVSETEKTATGQNKRRKVRAASYEYLRIKVESDFPVENMDMGNPETEIIIA